MTIYASTKTHNTDPLPWTYDGFGVQGRSAGYTNAPNIKHDPRPEFDHPRAHEGNPILIAARESYDGSDPWGFALGWLYAFRYHQGYETLAEVAECGEDYELETLVSLRTNDGKWNLPPATEQHFEHAYAVFDRMADVARANGLDY